jgi:hypothetical protein
VRVSWAAAAGSKPYAWEMDLATKAIHPALDSPDGKVLLEQFRARDAELPRLELPPPPPEPAP